MNHNNRIEFLPREDLITPEDAKRLVACWNACIGIDTKLLKPRMLAEQATHDNLRDTVGQAIHDVLTGWYETEDGTIGVDPFDSRNIDEIADAVIAVLPAAPAAEQAGPPPHPSYPHITQPYTLEEIRAQIASHDYSAELLLQHAMLLLNDEVWVEPQWQLERMRHIANEWADMATNGMQWLRNIKEGIGTVDDALANMATCYEHCRMVNDAPGLYGESSPPAPARQEWQPIETAPKDQFILVSCPSGYTTTPRVVTTAIMHSGYKAGRWVDHANDDLTDWGMIPTHWMPLPAAPITAAPAEGEKK